jgi:hypothetical protein
MLHKHGRQSSRRELTAAKSAREISPLIDCRLKLNEPHILQPCRVKLQTL